MATPTYTLLDSVTLASSAASVTFSSIDQSYGDLVLQMELKAVDSNGQITLDLNGATSGFSTVEMIGDGSSAISTTNMGVTPGRGYLPVLTNSGVFIPIATQIMDYSATDKHKTVLTRGGHPYISVAAGAIRYASTTAITSLVVSAVFGGTSFVAGSTFHLYGIAKAL